MSVKESIDTARREAIIQGYVVVGIRLDREAEHRLMKELAEKNMLVNLFEGVCDNFGNVLPNKYKGMTIVHRFNTSEEFRDCNGLIAVKVREVDGNGVLEVKFWPIVEFEMLGEQKK